MSWLKPENWLEQAASDCEKYMQVALESSAPYGHLGFDPFYQRIKKAFEERAIFEETETL